MAELNSSDEINITSTELQAEMESLRSLRRRSLSTNASPEGVLDPDLPSQLSLSSTLPSSDLTRTGSLQRRPSNNDPNRVPHQSPPTPPPQLPQLNMDENLPLSQIIPSNFWLPAHLHPELAPAEFKNFIRDQTLARQKSVGHDGTPQDRNMGPIGIARSISARRSINSKDGGFPTRKKSMLSKQYHPKASDSVAMPNGAIIEEEEEKEKFHEAEDGGEDEIPKSPIADPSASPFRAGSTRRGGMAALSFLTINDLQMLEKIAADGESPTDEGMAAPGQTGPKGLRRSLSLNPVHLAAAAAQVEAAQLNQPLPPIPPQNDISPPPASPIDIIPSPSTDAPESSLHLHTNSQILRRSARTVKARKGTEGGGRYGTGRRIKQSLSPADAEDLKADMEGRRSEEVDDDQTPRNSPIVSTDDFQAFNMERSGSVGRHGQSYSADYRLNQPQEKSFGKHTASVSADYSSAVSASETYDKAYGLPGRHSSFESPDISQGKHSSIETVTDSYRDSFTSVSSRSSTDDVARATSPPKTQEDVPMITLDAPSSSVVEYPPAAHEHTRKVSSESPNHSHSPSPSPSPSPSLSKERNSLKSSGKEKKLGWARIFGSSSNSKSEESVADDSTSFHSVVVETEKEEKKKKGKKQKIEIVTDLQKAKSPSSATSEKEPKEKGKEKDGFFGSLFGGSKKKDPETIAEKQFPAAPFNPLVSPTASGIYNHHTGNWTNFYRLPIHVERAVYRLSHIKLANPRRPLYEQVLISNLMFWYLGIINKPNDSFGADGSYPPSHPNATLPKPPPHILALQQQQAQMQQLSHTPVGEEQPLPPSKKPAVPPKRNAEPTIKQTSYDVQSRSIELERERERELELEREQEFERERHREVERGRPVSLPASSRAHSPPNEQQQTTSTPQHSHSQSQPAVTAYAYSYQTQPVLLSQGLKVTPPISVKRLPNESGFEVVTRRERLASQKHLQQQHAAKRGSSLEQDDVEWNSRGSKLGSEGGYVRR